MPVAAIQYLAYGHSDEDVKRAIILRLDRILLAPTAFYTSEVAEELAEGLRRSRPVICRASISRQAVRREQKARSKWRDSISQRKASPIEAILSPHGRAGLAIVLLALSWIQ